MWRNRTSKNQGGGCFQTRAWTPHDDNDGDDNGGDDDGVVTVQLSHDFVEGTLNDEKTSRIWDNLKIVLGRWVGG
jgi:hypothetical protein